MLVLWQSLPERSDIASTVLDGHRRQADGAVICKGRQGRIMWWYRLRTWSGKEEKLRRQLMQWRETAEADDLVSGTRVRRVVVPERPEYRVGANRQGRFECRLRRFPLFPGWVFVGLEKPLGDGDYHRLLALAEVAAVEPEPLPSEFVAGVLLNPNGPRPRIRLPFRRNQRLRLVGGAFAGYECQYKRVSDFRVPRLEVVVLAHGTFHRIAVEVGDLAWPAEYLRCGGSLHGRIAVPGIMRAPF